jgi:hypothetical protein
MGNKKSRRNSSGTLTLCSQQMNKLRLPNFSRLGFFLILSRALNHSNDALPSPYQVTLVGLYFSCLREQPIPLKLHATGVIGLACHDHSAG